MRGAKKSFYFLFYHPDYTVGTGISPVREHELFADFTAGGELHPAPKKIQLWIYYSAVFLKMQVFYLDFFRRIFEKRKRKSLSIDKLHVELRPTFAYFGN